jgi:putative PIN family toxin of toxin-antitoxin system
MIHAVADTNTAISGLLSSGTAAGVLRLAYERRVTLWGCSESVAEFRRVIRYSRLEARIATLYRGVIAFEREYERLLNIVSIDGVAPGVLVPADRDDEVFIRTAIAARAGFIVTRDPDLLDLKRYERVLMVTPEEFMRAWHGASGAAPAKTRKWKLPWRRSK